MGFTQVNRNVKLIKRWFDEVLPSFLEKECAGVALLHINADLYLSTKTILDLLRYRLILDTVLLLD